ncbi:MAG: YcaO-like family protein [Candidatus Omnitrophota bacterium]|jgi:ribosomal protein S12 methylthiotransferase accessory factor
MKLRDCYKNYAQGVGKAVTPEETCRIVFKRIRGRDILDSIYPVKRPGGIPQYRIEGGNEFKQIVTVPGTNGKGHTRILALASGMMELVERYSCYKYFRQAKGARAASFRDMRGMPYRLSDFPSFAFGFRGGIKMRDIQDCRVRWFKAYTLGGGRLYFPFPLAGYLLQGTTGMASGNSLEEALLQAICEIVERHCLSKIQRARRLTPLVRVSSIGSRPAAALINKFRRLGHEVMIKDFSLGTGIPVVGVVRMLGKGRCFVTAGASADPCEALIRALTENSQSGIAEYSLPIAEAAHHFKGHAEVDFAQLPGFSCRNIKTELTRLEGLLSRLGMRVFFHNTTDKELGIPAVVVMVTNTELLEKIMPSPGGFAAWKNIYHAVIQEQLDMRDYPAALKLIDKFSALDGENPEVYRCYKGIALKWMRQYASAARCFQENISSLKEDGAIKALSLFQSGLCLHALGDMKKAGDYYFRFIGMRPDFNVSCQWMYYKAVHYKDKEQLAIMNEAAKICMLLRAGLKVVKNRCKSRENQR